MEWLASLGGAALDAITGASSAKRQAEHQEEFAKKGIRWRVADAKAAGLHPLAALGAAGASFSPVATVTDFSSAGQDISRSIQATRTERERREVQAAELARNAALDQMARERSEAEVRRLDAEARLATLQGDRLLAQVGPPMPSGGPSGVAGSGVSTWSMSRPNPIPADQVKAKAAEITSHQSDRPHVQAGRHAGGVEVRTPLGNVVVPDTNLVEADDPITQAAWMLILNSDRYGPWLRDQLPDRVLGRAWSTVEKWMRGAEAKRRYVPHSYR